MQLWRWKSLRWICSRHVCTGGKVMQLWKPMRQHIAAEKLAQPNPSITPSEILESIHKKSVFNLHAIENHQHCFKYLHKSHNKSPQRLHQRKKSFTMQIFAPSLHYAMQSGSFSSTHFQASSCVDGKTFSRSGNFQAHPHMHLHKIQLHHEYRIR